MRIISLADQAKQLVHNGVSSLGAWFGPSDAPNAVAPQDTAGRQFDYESNYNLITQPRRGEAISFKHLRAFADQYDLLRLVIETRKDQMAKLPWSIRIRDNISTPQDESVIHDQRCEELTRFFEFPDKEHSWDAWLRMLLEDLLVIDAPTAYIRKTRGGGVYSIDPIDGATITRVLDAYGRTPVPPETAYQQVLKGVPAVSYTREELIYLPRNPRTHKVYGYSPVEQIITTVNIALNRQVYQLGYYTEGSTPDLIFKTPKEWTPEQIGKFERYWNSIYSSNPTDRRKTKFVPDGIDPIDTKDKALKDEYDEWLARIVCFAFSISPQAFVKDMNRATAETAQEAALSEGLAPLMQWVKGLMDRLLVQVFGYSDLEFKWDDQKSIKPKEQADIDAIYVNAKILTPDEVRADRFNKSPMTEEQRASLTPSPSLPDQTVKQPEGEETQKVAKAKKRVAPIDRDRELAEQTRQQLTDYFTLFLQDQAQDIGLQVIALKEAQLEKGVSDKVSNILDGLTFGAWTGITAWFSDITQPIALDGVQKALEQLNRDLEAKAFQLANTQAIDFAKHRGAELVGMKYVKGELVPNPSPIFSITESTRDMLRSSVTDALEKGLSNDDLMATIKKDHAFSAERAEMIARTETAIADIKGNMVAYESLGVEEKQWLTAPGCCDKCGALNGKIVKINAPFVEGKYLADPPLHPHCRCDVLPVI